MRASVFIEQEGRSEEVAEENGLAHVFLSSAFGLDPIEPGVADRHEKLEGIVQDPLVICMQLRLVGP